MKKLTDFINEAKQIDEKYVQKVDMNQPRCHVFFLRGTETEFSMSSYIQNQSSLSDGEAAFSKSISRSDKGAVVFGAVDASSSDKMNDINQYFRKNKDKWSTKSDAIEAMKKFIEKDNLY